MNIFLKTFSAKKYYPSQKNICHISASCRGCGVLGGCVFGRCPHHSSLGSETRTRGLQSAPTSAASTRRHTHTAGNSGDVRGKGSLNKRTTKAQNNFKVYVLCKSIWWCFISNAILFRINEVDNNFVTRYDFKHFDAVYASKVPFLKIVQKCITQKI